MAKFRIITQLEAAEIANDSEQCRMLVMERIRYGSETVHASNDKAAK